jgi:hypothetical protein
MRGSSAWLRDGREGVSTLNLPCAQVPPHACAASPHVQQICVAEPEVRLVSVTCKGSLRCLGSLRQLFSSASCQFARMPLHSRLQVAACPAACGFLLRSWLTTQRACAHSVCSSGVKASPLGLQSGECSRSQQVQPDAQQAGSRVALLHHAYDDGELVATNRICISTDMTWPCLSVSGAQMRRRLQPSLASS